jgi:hypothetical protein
MAAKQPFEIPVGMRRACRRFERRQKDTKPACVFQKLVGQRSRKRRQSTGFSARPTGPG